MSLQAKFGQIEIFLDFDSTASLKQIHVYFRPCLINFSRDKHLYDITVQTFNQL